MTMSLIMMDAIGVGSSFLSNTSGPTLPKLTSVEKDEVRSLNRMFSLISSTGAKCTIGTYGWHVFSYSRMARTIKEFAGTNTTLNNRVAVASSHIPSIFLPGQWEKGSVKALKAKLLTGKKAALQGAQTDVEFMVAFLKPTAGKTGKALHDELRDMRGFVSKAYDGSASGAVNAASLDALILKLRTLKAGMDRSKIDGTFDQLRALAAIHFFAAERLANPQCVNNERKASIAGNLYDKYVLLGRLFKDLARIKRDPGAAQLVFAQEGSYSSKLDKVTGPVKFMYTVLNHWKRSFVADRSITAWYGRHLQRGAITCSALMPQTVGYATYIADGNVDPMAYVLKIAEMSGTMCVYDFKKPGGGGGGSTGGRKDPPSCPPGRMLNGTWTGTTLIKRYKRGRVCIPRNCPTSTRTRIWWRSRSTGECHSRKKGGGMGGGGYDFGSGTPK